MRQPGPGLTERGLGVVGAATAVALLAVALAAPPYQPVLAQGPVAPANPPAASPPAASPQEDQRPVFRGGTAFVAVDAYPRRDGKVVEGLTAADFEVKEDGKVQNVEAFQFIRFETALVDTERRDPTSIADAERQAADPRNRLFVIYLDPYHLTREGGVHVQSTVMAFLTRTIGARDLFAMMTPELPPSQLTFGRRLETLEDDLETFWRETRLDPNRELPQTPVEQRIKYECDLSLARHRQDVLMTSLEGLVRRLDGLKDERKNVLFISEGWGPMPAVPMSAGGGSGSIPEVGVGPRGRLGMGNQQPTGRDRAWCDQQAGRLASIDFEDRFRRLLNLARESNVTFYPVDVGGLRVDQDRSAQDTLRTLAENTDGTAIFNTNDTVGAVRRLTDSIAAYYLLGYYSSNPAADGRFRRIEVRIKQPNVDVSARPGYFAPTAAMLAASKAPPPPPATAVDTELGRLSRARADAELHSYAVHNGTRLDVVAELASRLMERPDWKTGADVRVTVQPPSGAPVEGRGRIEAGTRSVVVPVAIAADDRGPWKVTLRVSSNDALLDTSTAAAPAVGPIFGEPMLFRANPSPRAIARAVADLQYRRVERIHVEWRALKPLTDRTVRLLDRQGQPLPVTPTLSDRDDGGVTVVSVDITLAPLREGDYVIELTGTSGTETERELLAFKVVR